MYSREAKELTKTFMMIEIIINVLVSSFASREYIYFFVCYGSTAIKEFSTFLYGDGLLTSYSDVDPRAVRVRSMPDTT